MNRITCHTASPDPSPEPQSPQEQALCPDCGRVLLHCRCGGGEHRPPVAHVRAMRITDLDRYSQCDPTRRVQLEAMLGSRSAVGRVAITRSGTVIAGSIFVFRKHGIILRRLAVHPDWRRRGVGRHLLQHLQKLLTGTGRDWITAFIPETAVGLQILFRDRGFVCEQTVPPAPGAASQRDWCVFRYEASQPHGVRFRPVHRLRHLV